MDNTAYVMPEAAKIVSILMQVQSFGNDEHTQRVFAIVAKKLAGRDLYAHGIRMALMLAFADACRDEDLPSQVGNIFMMETDNYAEALMRSAAATDDNSIVCPQCDGSGTTGDELCDACGGSGRAFAAAPDGEPGGTP